jgi:uncharacterized protein (DUF433 family)
MHLVQQLLWLHQRFLVNSEIMVFNHIVSDPSILGGKPIIKGSRISVQLILEWLADGASVTDIVTEFPHLPKEGVKEAILYAARFIEQKVIIEVNKPEAQTA